MSELKEQIQNRLTHSDFLQHTVPALTEWGVMDEDVMVHSIGVSAWNTLGHELGFQAIAECPAPAGIGDDIRSDSSWFDKGTQKPVAFIEFERYDGSRADKDKLNNKLANLMEAAYRWSTPSPLMILIAWNKDIVTAPDTESLNHTVINGLKNKRGQSIPGRHPRDFLFGRFMMSSQKDSTLVLQRIWFKE